MRVDIIPFAQVVQDILHLRVFAFGEHFVETPLRADLLRCRQKHLYFRIREYGCAYVPAIHHYASVRPEGVEFVIHEIPYICKGRHGTYLPRDFKRANLLLHASLPDIQLSAGSEVKVQPLKGIPEFRVDDAVGGYEILFLREESDASVQGSGIQIQQPECFCHGFCKCAFACGGMAVNGDDDFRDVHRLTKIENFIDICISNAFCVMKILIVDDERAIRNSLSEIMADEGYCVDTAENGRAAVEMAEKEHYDVVFCDIKMPEMDGIEVLEQLKADGVDSEMIMISGHGDISTAVDCIKKGAFDFIQKPLDLNRILITVKNATDKTALVKETKILKKKVFGQQMIGESPAMMRIREMIGKVASTDARVLIMGSNGTGKELVARSLHQQSGRSAMPYVEVNCAAIPSELIESELFGHEKGSFTSAIKQHKGKFEQADGGTLFLDEIGDMSLAAQAKVLRVLQERKLSRVGSDKDIEVDVRVIAATNKDLRAEIEAGRFREDLFHRLSVIVINVPSLDERKSDIPLLVDYFIEQICSEGGMKRKHFSPEAVGKLQEKSWTGNIRELRNVVERLLILGGDVVSAEDVSLYV